MRKRILTVATVLLLVALVLPGVVAARGPVFETEDNGDATVYVIHGIPGVTVDVLVDDALCLLEGFEFGDIAGPVPLAPATYNIKIMPANADFPCTETPVIEADVPFVADENATVIAHLTEAGDPTATKFVNNVDPTGRGKARVAVRHTAAAGGVDVDVRRPLKPTPELFIPDLENPDGVEAEIRPGDWDVTIYPTGDPTPVFGPATVTLKPFTGYFVYAVGSPADGTFTLIIHTIYGLRPMKFMPAR